MIQRFSSLINPIDGKTCQSEPEQILINLYTKLKTLRPKYLQQQDSTRQKLPTYAKSIVEKAQTAVERGKIEGDTGEPRADK